MLQNNRNKVILKTDLPVWCLTEYNTNSISHKPSISIVLIVVIGISWLSGLIQLYQCVVLLPISQTIAADILELSLVHILYKPVVLLQVNQN